MAQKKVRTVTGDELGRTLINEHLSVDWGEMLGRPKVHDFDYEEGEPITNDFTYLSRVFLPKLQREAGVTDQQLSVMLEQNPRRMLAFAD